ncbi:STT3A glycosyltransferase, partial [Polyodon spathula]|nr:STT3A glycosyltransferase [Polyodon spathula]
MKTLVLGADLTLPPPPSTTERPPGYDRVRNAEIGNKDFELDVLEEAYTTEHWLVRIYKVKDLDNRGLSRT